jgi:hypothetical protein
MRRFVQPPRAASTSFVRKRLSGVADAFDELSGFAIEMEHTTIAHCKTGNPMVQVPSVGSASDIQNRGSGSCHRIAKRSSPTKAPEHANGLGRTGRRRSAENLRGGHPLSAAKTAYLDIGACSYSSRSTARGSTRVARSAGTRLAANDTRISSMVTARKVTRSRELTP